MTVTREFRPAVGTPVLTAPSYSDLAFQLRDEREAHAATQRELAAARVQLDASRRAGLAREIAGAAYCDLAAWVECNARRALIEDFEDTRVIEVPS